MRGMPAASHGGEQAPVHRPRRALLGHAQRAARAVELRRAARVVLGLDEVGQHVAIAPAGRALRLPGVVVERAAAHVQHRVHRARAAEALAARDVQRAAVYVRLGLGRVVPVELGVELVGERRRDLDVQRAVAPAGLEQQHAHRGVLRQAVGEHASRRARADDHVVVHGASSLARWRVGQRSRAARADGLRGREAVLARVERARLLQVLAHVPGPVGDDPPAARRGTTNHSPSTPCRRSAPAARGRWPARRRRAPRSRARRGRAAAASAWRR